jgi:putative DNA primase/helicase
VDGEALAHEYSSGYDGYTFDETANELDRLREYGPTTCRKFHSDNPATCEACPHWGKIKSPIVLGYRRKTTAGSQPGGAVAAGPARLRDLQWEYTEKGAYRAKSYANTVLGLRKLSEEYGVKFRYDVFHERRIIELDGVSTAAAGLPAEAGYRKIREMLNGLLRVDTGRDNVREAVDGACEANHFDPVRDYADGLVWDGRPRLDRWLIDYMGAADTEFNRTIGRLVLIAAVRRVREPGTKFDQVIVFEGLEGGGKSTAIEILAGRENFSDQTILGLSDERLQERMRGVWLYEIADLTGMRKADIDQMKAQLSRVEDRARGAYERAVNHAPRRCIYFATTNESTYLKSQTGDRRFWPVRVQRVALDALSRDRDQLWAEAAHLEAQGASIVLPENLWTAARTEQAQRQEQDPWDDLLAGVKGKVYPDPANREGYEERVASASLLTGPPLLIEASRLSDRDTKRLGHCMRRLGWTGPKNVRIEGHLVKGYSRPAKPPVAGATVSHTSEAATAAGFEFEHRRLALLTGR